MWVFAVTAVMAVAVASFMSRQLDDEPVLDAAQGRVMAERMAVYRTAVIEWARSHPHFEGPVDESAVAPPPWWRGHKSMQAAIQGRVIAVYVTGPAARGVLVESLRLSGGSIWVGTAKRASGTLHSPTAGDTGIGLPEAVPDEAVVWLALRD